MNLMLYEAIGLSLILRRCIAVFNERDELRTGIFLTRSITGSVTQALKQDGI